MPGNLKVLQSSSEKGVRKTRERKDVSQKNYLKEVKLDKIREKLFNGEIREGGGDFGKKEGGVRGRGRRRGERSIGKVTSFGEKGASAKVKSKRLLANERFPNAFINILGGDE